MRPNNEPHASPPYVCASIRSTFAERSPSRCNRECCTPAAARCLSAKAQTTSADLVRSAVLGRFVWGSAQLARPPALRTGRHELQMLGRQALMDNRRPVVLGVRQRCYSCPNARDLDPFRLLLISIAGWLG